MDRFDIEREKHPLSNISSKAAHVTDGFCDEADEATEKLSRSHRFLSSSGNENIDISPSNVHSRLITSVSIKFPRILFTQIVLNYSNGRIIFKYNSIFFKVFSYVYCKLIQNQSK